MSCGIYFGRSHTRRDLKKKGVLTILDFESQVFANAGFRLKIYTFIQQQNHAKQPFFCNNKQTNSQTKKQLLNL